LKAEIVMIHAKISKVLLTKLILISCCLISAKAIAIETVLINSPLSHTDTRYDYPKILLQQILNATEAEFGKAIVKNNGIPMKRTRALSALEKGQDLHVMAEAPKKDWTSRLLTVYIPIRKGIQGYRLFLIHEKNRQKLNKTHTFDKFKSLSTGSGDQWSTTRVLDESGFNVVRGSNYEGLFAMLMRGRFVTFGRGINEIFEEYSSHKDKFPRLGIDERFVLYTPLPTYFFVSPLKPQLRNRIEVGLNKLINSGAFTKIFETEFGDLIEKAKLSERILFEVPNPNLSDKDPIHIEKYWYQSNR
jgi:hypothetical protein